MLKKFALIALVLSLCPAMLKADPFIIDDFTHDTMYKEVKVSDGLNSNIQASYKHTADGKYADADVTLKAFKTGAAPWFRVSTSIYNGKFSASSDADVKGAWSLYYENDYIEDLANGTSNNNTMRITFESCDKPLESFKLTLKDNAGNLNTKILSNAIPDQAGYNYDFRIDDMGVDLSDVASISLNFEGDYASDFSISSISTIHTPDVPEPATIALLCAGGAAILARKRKRS